MRDLMIDFLALRELLIEKKIITREEFKVKREQVKKISRKNN